MLCWQFGICLEVKVIVRFLGSVEFVFLPVNLVFHLRRSRNQSRKQFMSWKLVMSSDPITERFYNTASTRQSWLLDLVPLKSVRQFFVQKKMYSRAYIYVFLKRLQLFLKYCIAYRKGMCIVDYLPVILLYRSTSLVDLYDVMMFNLLVRIRLKH